MHCNDELQVKRDANGEPDVGYYINQAHRLRGQMIHDLGAQAAAGLRRQLQQLVHAMRLGGHLPSLHH